MAPRRPRAAIVAAVAAAVAAAVVALLSAPVTATSNAGATTGAAVTSVDVATLVLLEDAFPAPPRSVVVHIATVAVTTAEPLYLAPAAPAVASPPRGPPQLASGASHRAFGVTARGALQLHCHQPDADAGAADAAAPAVYAALGDDDVPALAAALPHDAVARFAARGDSAPPNSVRATFAIVVDAAAPAGTGTQVPPWLRHCDVVAGAGMLLDFTLRPTALRASLQRVQLTPACAVTTVVIPGVRQPLAASFAHLLSAGAGATLGVDGDGGDGDDDDGDDDEFVVDTAVLVEVAPAPAARAHRGRQSAYNAADSVVGALRASAHAAPPPPRAAPAAAAAPSAMFVEDAADAALRYNPAPAVVAVQRAAARHHRAAGVTGSVMWLDDDATAAALVDAALAASTRWLVGAPLAAGGDAATAARHAALLEMEDSAAAAAEVAAAAASPWEHDNDEFYAVEATHDAAFRAAFPAADDRAVRELAPALRAFHAAAARSHDAVLAEVASGSRVAAATAAVAAVAAYLGSHQPGLKQILTPIIGKTFEPVTAQITPTIASQMIDALGSGEPQNLKAESPGDVAWCLTTALTYNLTNLLTDAVTSLTTPGVCTALTAALTPTITDAILRDALPAVHDDLASAKAPPPAVLAAAGITGIEPSLAAATAAAVSPTVATNLDRTLRLSLVPRLTRLLTHGLVPALTTALDAVQDVSSHGGVAGGTLEDAATRLAGDRLRALALWGSLDAPHQDAVRRACAACGGFDWPPRPLPLPLDAAAAAAGQLPAARPALSADSAECTACHSAGAPFGAYLRQYFAEYFAHYYGCYASQYYGAAQNASDAAAAAAAAASAASAAAAETAAGRAAVRAAAHSRKAQVHQ